jgi:hypothetical protein
MKTSKAPTKKKSTKTPAHGLSFIDERSADSVALSLSFSDALYAAELLKNNENSVLGGFGPTFINNLCELTLQSLITQKEQNSDDEGPLTKAIRRCFLDETIKHHFKNQLSTITQADSANNTISPASDPRLHSPDKHYQSRNSALIKQAIIFAERTNSDSPFKGTKTSRKPVQDAINNLTKKTGKISNIKQQATPFEICEILASHLIQKLQLQYKKTYRSHSEITEFIIRFFFSYTYLLEESKASIGFIDEYKVTYLSDNADQMRNIVQQGSQLEQNFKTVLDAAGRFNSPSAPNSPKADTILKKMIGKRRGETLIKTIETELESSDSPITDFISEEKLISKTIAAEINNHKDNINLIRQESINKQKETCKFIISIYSILNPNEQPPSIDRFYTWDKMIEKYNSPNAKKQPQSQSVLTSPEHTSELFSTVTKKLSEWIFTNVFSNKLIQDFIHALNPNHSPNFEYLEYCSEQNLKGKNYPTQKDLLFGRSIIIRAINEISLKLEFIDTLNTDQKQLKSNLKVIKKLLSFNIHQHIRTSKKNEYNAILFTRLLSSLRKKIHRFLLTTVKQSVEIIQDTTKDLSSKLETCTAHIEKKLNDVQPQTRNNMQKLFACCHRPYPIAEIDTVELTEHISETLLSMCNTHNKIVILRGNIQRYEKECNIENLHKQKQQLKELLTENALMIFKCEFQIMRLELINFSESLDDIEALQQSDELTKTARLKMTECINIKKLQLKNEPETPNNHTYYTISPRPITSPKKQRASKRNISSPPRSGSTSPFDHKKNAQSPHSTIHEQWFRYFHLTFALIQEQQTDTLLDSLAAWITEEELKQDRRNHRKLKLRKQKVRRRKQEQKTELPLLSVDSILKYQQQTHEINGQSNPTDSSASSINKHDHKKTIDRHVNISDTEGKIDLLKPGSIQVKLTCVSGPLTM